MNLQTCLFHFTSLTTSFKILHWDSQPYKTKKKKMWGRTNLLEVKEGEEVHEVASEKWEGAEAWSIYNDRWRNFSKTFNFYSSFMLLQRQFLWNLQQNKVDFYFGPGSIFRPKSSICSGIAGMTLVRPVFKPEWNTSVPVPAKVPVRYKINSIDIYIYFLRNNSIDMNSWVCSTNK